MNEYVILMLFFVHLFFIILVTYHSSSFPCPWLKISTLLDLCEELAFILPLLFSGSGDGKKKQDNEEDPEDQEDKDEDREDIVQDEEDHEENIVEDDDEDVE